MKNITRDNLRIQTSNREKNYYKWKKKGQERGVNSYYRWTVKQQWTDERCKINHNKRRYNVKNK